MVMGIVSQYWFRRRYPKAFAKYNYLFAGAMDGGTQVISFILNFAVFGAAGNPVNFPIWVSLAPCPQREADLTSLFLVAQWGNPDPQLLSTDRCLAAGL